MAASVNEVLELFQPDRAQELTLFWVRLGDDLPNFYLNLPNSAFV